MRNRETEGLRITAQIQNRIQRTEMKREKIKHKELGVWNGGNGWKCTPRRKKRKELGVRKEGENMWLVVGKVI